MACDEFSRSTRFELPAYRAFEFGQRQVHDIVLSVDDAARHETAAQLQEVGPIEAVAPRVQVADLLATFLVADRPASQRVDDRAGGSAEPGLDGRPRGSRVGSSVSSHPVHHVPDQLGLLAPRGDGEVVPRLTQVPETCEEFNERGLRCFGLPTLGFDDGGQFGEMVIGIDIGSVDTEVDLGDVDVLLGHALSQHGRVEVGEERNDDVGVGGRLPDAHQGAD